jgi:hypothetical protein
VSTATAPPSRPLASRIGIPVVGDVHAPGIIARRPRWLVAGVVLVVLVAISALLRTRQLGGELWFNEAIAVGMASRSFGEVLHAARVGGSAPLYYLLLHFWVNGLGTGEAAVRGLSLLCALLSIPAAGWAGWSLSGERAALLGATLFAFSAAFTQFAEQAQPYALLMLLSLIAVTAFLHAFVYRRRGYLWLFVAALEAALYTQGSTALLVFGLAVGLLVIMRCAAREQRRAILRDGLLCAVALIVLFIPWIPATIDQIAHATSPWHYVPLIGADVPSQLFGGERVDAALAVVLVIGIAPLLLVRSRRRSPEAVVIWTLIAIGVATIGFSAVTQLATPDWVARYLEPATVTLLLLATLTAARARVVGLVAVLLVVVFCADPAAFAPGHLSNMREIKAQLAPRLHPGDVVAVAQPEQTPLAWYYMPSGLRYETTMGPVSDPAYVDWDGALGRLQRAAPVATLGRLVASLRPGEQLLFVRPLTEGGQNWQSPWTSLVRRRAAQWGQLLTDDVAHGTLTPVGTAPISYPGDCCVADSAVLYRKAS